MKIKSSCVNIITTNNVKYALTTLEARYPDLKLLTQSNNEIDCNALNIGESGYCPVIENNTKYGSKSIVYVNICKRVE
ncbi:MAG: hypothetical protein PHC43_00420 [Candidatus Marinimicrobia bacterium]|jgi:hypothetical protein|nr:hypothetical protein [Candidatus Neomarinimicrobiota bacterium]